MAQAPIGFLAQHFAAFWIWPAAHNGSLKIGVQNSSGAVFRPSAEAVHHVLRLLIDLASHTTELKQKIVLKRVDRYVAMI